MGRGELKLSVSILALYVGYAAAVATGLWAFATLAAHHVMDPHLSAAKSRVRIMCESQKVAQENQLAICATVGATCKRIDPAIFDAACEEPSP